jgi:hypothetical protein
MHFFHFKKLEQVLKVINLLWKDYFLGIEQCRGHETSCSFLFFIFLWQCRGMGVCDRGGPHLVDESYQLYMH